MRELKKMSQQLRAMTALPEEQGLISSTHTLAHNHLSLWF